MGDTHTPHGSNEYLIYTTLSELEIIMREGSRAFYDPFV
jgi:hypothetical protein